MIRSACEETNREEAEVQQRGTSGAPQRPANGKSSGHGENREEAVVQQQRSASGAPQQDKRLEFLRMLDQVRDRQLPTLNKVDEANFQGKWERIRAIMDSGATVPVMSPSTGKHYQGTDSEASRAGVMYACANGDTIPNLGEKAMPVVTQEGTVRGYFSQIADVTTPLQSVRHLYKSGHLVVFDGPESFMYNKHTGEVNAIEDDGFNYVQELWVIPPDELHNVNTPDFTGQHP
jgi:hypothetical protein